MNKYLIVNADDFGFDAGIDSGIFESFEKGITSSVSIVANGLNFDNALNLVRKSNKALGVGVHLSLLGEKPVLPPEKIPGLVDKNGYFHSNFFDLAGRIYLSKIDLLEVEKEAEAQIAKVLQNSITPTHIDGDRFVHLLPPIFDIAIKLAKKFRIKYVRYPYFDNRMPAFSFNNVIKKSFLNLFSKKQSRIMEKNNIRHVDYSYGFMASGRVNKDMFTRFLHNIKIGLSDINLHPGYMPICEKYTSWKYNWETEKDLLINPEIKALIQRLNIGLVNYAE
ncbi:ChbG/HpnK family deacetylase [bacterium]|nr:MAG: ChbG/HpnK family deacetylase [bacterium]